MAVNTVYSLVLFVDDKKNEGDLESIDMVPSSWLSYDEENNCLKCPCYDKQTAKNKEIFDNAVKNLLLPPTSWNLHRVEIRGYANTYDSGLARLETLEIKRFAFTTDDDANDEEKQKTIEKQYHVKGKKNSEKKVEELLSECQEHFAAKNANNSNVAKSKSTNPRSTKPKTKDNLDDIIIALNEMQTIILDRFNKLTYQVGSLQSEMLKIKAEIKELKNLKISQQNASAGPSGTYKIEGYDTPFKNLNDFKKFDKDLKKNVELRQKVISIMYPCLDLTEKPIESIIKIAKKFVTKEVLENYTAVKERKNKEIFKKTSFYSCMYDVVLSEFGKTEANKINEKEFQKAIGKTINYSKDWDGGRKDRNEIEESKNKKRKITPDESTNATSEPNSSSSTSSDDE